MASQAARATAAWGDAEARRRDILDSAERLVSESGYTSLTMRAIAGGAGVSAGTVYQYFAGKDDVFAALTTRHLDALRDTLAAVDRDLGVAGVLREVLPQVTELWQRLGRSTPQWEARVLQEREHSRVARASAGAYRRTLRTLAEVLHETAAAAGQTLVRDPALAQWVWDSLIGLADDLLLGGPEPNRLSPHHLVDFATAAIERGLVAPGPAPDSPSGSPSDPAEGPAAGGMLST